MHNLMTNCRKIATLLAAGGCVLFFLPNEATRAQTTRDPGLETEGPLLAPMADADGLPLAPNISLPQDSQPLESQDEEFSFMLRGPVHEAFAEPWQKDPVDFPLVSETPPPPVDEVPPEVQPAGTNVQWISGYWAWDDQASKFIWISGLWRDVPPGQSWNPGQWFASAEGWQWIPGYWASAEQTETTFVPEPPQSIDNGPSSAAPGEDYFYVPGSWLFQDDQYVWRAGYWCPRLENRVWVPAYYIGTAEGYVYCPGYWDYPLEDRGILFAPVEFQRPVYLNVGWRYQPACVVNTGVDFFVHLFAHPVRGYCFGDWYDFGHIGYRPWVHSHFAFGCYDPLFTYYRFRGFRFRGGNDYWINHIYNRHRHFATNRQLRPQRHFIRGGGQGQGPGHHQVASRPGNHQDQLGSLYRDVAKRTKPDRPYRTERPRPGAGTRNPSEVVSGRGENRGEVRRRDAARGNADRVAGNGQANRGTGNRGNESSATAGQRERNRGPGNQANGNSQRAANAQTLRDSVAGAAGRTPRENSNSRERSTPRTGEALATRQPGSAAAPRPGRPPQSGNREDRQRSAGRGGSSQLDRRLQQQVERLRDQNQRLSSPPSSRRTDSRSATVNGGRAPNPGSAMRSANGPRAANGPREQPTGHAQPTGRQGSTTCGVRLPITPGTALSTRGLADCLRILPETPTRIASTPDRTGGVLPP